MALICPFWQGTIDDGGLACEGQVLAGRQEPGREQQVVAGLVGVRRDSRQGGGEQEYKGT